MYRIRTRLSGLLAALPVAALFAAPGICGEPDRFPPSSAIQIAQAGRSGGYGGGRSSNQGTDARRRYDPGYTDEYRYRSPAYRRGYRDGYREYQGPGYGRGDTHRYRYDYGHDRYRYRDYGTSPYYPGRRGYYSHQPYGRYRGYGFGFSRPYRR